MKIEEKVCFDILKYLQEFYPHPLMTDGYTKLLRTYGEDKLDGHILYMYQKGLISSDIHYAYTDEDGLQIDTPKRGEGRWLIDTMQTFITATGLDLLDKQ